jgi:riboflavin synthase
MFTGIITDIGHVAALEKRGDLRARISCNYEPDSIDLGASIACNGVCLTVVERGMDATGWFDVDISAETVSKTNVSDWAIETPINLERALRVGDELGGHIVSGHVDGIATVSEVKTVGDSLAITLQAPEHLARFIAPKGSVALNGTSLTVNDVETTSFGINLIAHTQTVTTWGQTSKGDKINLEIDTLARYVARLKDWD